jgi:hypothetical protein
MPTTDAALSTAKPRPRRVAAERVRTLKVDGNAASEIYLGDALRYLARVKTARAHSMAFALFPNRSQLAAFAAVQRILTNARTRGFVSAAVYAPTQHRYYAMTKRGAAWLSEQHSEAGPFSATTAHLAAVKWAEHREWTSMIEVSANARVGLESMDEFHIRGDAGVEVRNRYDGRVPDVLTFIPKQGLVFWHEVELSRRSRWTPEVDKKRKAGAERQAHAKAEAQGRDNVVVTWSVPRSGVEWFELTLRSIHRLRYVTHRAVGAEFAAEFEIALILHCKTEVIRNELARLIRKTLGVLAVVTERQEGQHFELPFASDGGQTFNIFLPLLPANSDHVWHDSGCLPWPGAPAALKPDAELRGEHFIAERSVGIRLDASSAAGQTGANESAQLDPTVPRISETFLMAS